MKEKLILEAYLKFLNEGAPAVIGTAIAGVMGASALSNVYTAYKERVREYGRTLKECKEKCEIRFSETNIKKHDYTEEDLRKLRQNKQECINKCNARYYKDVEVAKEKKEAIKDKIKTFRSKYKKG